MTLQEFWDACSLHDWHYEMSDDHRVWTAGTAERNKLIAEAGEQGSQKHALFLAWQRHVFSGEPWGTAKQPQPERPA